MIGIYDYTVLFTLFGTMSGVVGIIATTEGNLIGAIVCLMLCGFFDMFDGMIARTKKNRSEFAKKYGVQLDSLSDVICFGALPTILGLTITKSLGWWQGLCMIYLITSISRLAYFNVEEEMRQKKEKGVRKTYKGLPVTVSALIFPFLYCFKNIAKDLFPAIFLIGMLITAFFQVSKIKLPHLNLKGLIICLIIGIILLTSMFFLLF